MTRSYEPLWLLDEEYGDDDAWADNTRPLRARTSRKSLRAFQADGGTRRFGIPDVQVGLAAYTQRLRELWRTLYNPLDGSGLLTRDEAVALGSTFSEDFSLRTVTFRPEAEERARPVYNEIVGIVTQSQIPGEIPTLCESCGTQVRPFDGDQFLYDWCPRCYAIAKFQLANALATASAKRAQRR